MGAPACGRLTLLVLGAPEVPSLKERAPCAVRVGVGGEGHSPRCRGVFPSPSRWLGSAPWSKSSCTRDRKPQGWCEWEPWLGGAVQGKQPHPATRPGGSEPWKVPPTLGSHPWDLGKRGHKSRRLVSRQWPPLSLAPQCLAHRCDRCHCRKQSAGRCDPCHRPHRGRRHPPAAAALTAQEEVGEQHVNIRGPRQRARGLVTCRGRTLGRT